MPLSTTEIKDCILELEERFPVDDWVMDGIRVWPLIRIHLNFALFFAGREEGPSPGSGKTTVPALAPVKRIGRSIFRFGRAYLSDSEHNAAGNRPADALFLTYTVHRTLLTGRWYDKYCDPYVDALASLGLTSLVLEMSAKEEYRVPRYGRSKFIQPWLEAIMLKSRLRRQEASREEELTGFAAMVADLERMSPGMAMPTLEKLRSRVVQLLYLKDYFGKILAGVKPRTVFIAEYYSLYGMALILASRECGIPTVDIQHGVQGDDHLAYGSWSKVPRDGYDLLPSVFWCWSDYEAGVIDRWNRDVRDGHRAFVGGNLWLELWREKGSDLVGSYDTMIERLKSGTGRALHVVVTLSLLSDLKEWMLAAMQASSADIFWWVRVHPCRFEERETVREMLAGYGLDNVELDQATDLPLQALLRHLDVNVTAFSSTVFDAECYGVPSVLTDPSGLTLFSEQIAAGLAVTAFDAAGLLQAIRGLAAKFGVMQRGLETSAVDNREIVGKFLSTLGGTACCRPETHRT